VSPAPPAELVEPDGWFGTPIGAERSLVPPQLASAFVATRSAALAHGRERRPSPNTMRAR
jgi:hypothetical protein